MFRRVFPVLILVVMLASAGPAFCQHSVLEKTGKSHEENLRSLVAENDPVQLEAFRMFEAGKFDDAKQVLSEKLSKETDQNKVVEILYFIALIEQYQDDYLKAVKHLKEIEKIYDSQKTPDLLKQAHLQRRMGDCYFGERKLEEANDCYKSSLAIINYLPEQDRMRVELLDSLSGCARFLNRPDDLKYYLEAQNKILSGPLVLDPLSQSSYYLWNNLELTKVYKDAGLTDKVEASRQVVHKVLSNLIDLRIQYERSGQLKGLKENMTMAYLQAERPETIADCLWLVNGFKVKSLPLITWRSSNQPLKAIILCIHGMGLENRAFEPLARIMSERGFLVAALDVRGFGSWLQVPGNETMDFTDTIGDIDHIVDFMKKQHEVPVFLLGESMGGAIVLKAAAELKGAVQGVISSVPSAEQFQKRKMALDVAFHFLKNPNKPYEVLDSIAKKATKRESLRAFWTGDDRAKSHVSAKEFIKFDHFMKGTVKACHRIDDTPVFIVQGLGDELVKPEGTVKMFKNVKSKDKNILIIGEAEHLIFETDQQNILLLNTITDWINNRLEPRVKVSSEPK